MNEEIKQILLNQQSILKFLRFGFPEIKTDDILNDSLGRRNEETSRLLNPAVSSTKKAHSDVFIERAGNITKHGHEAIRAVAGTDEEYKAYVDKYKEEEHPISKAVQDYYKKNPDGGKLKVFLEKARKKFGIKNIEDTNHERDEARKKPMKVDSDYKRGYADGHADGWTEKDEDNVQDRQDEQDVDIFRKWWKKNNKEIKEKGWDNWSFTRKLELALEIIKQEKSEGDKNGHN